MSMHPLTPSQTVGPFFHHCLLREDATRNDLSTPQTPGQPIRIEGHVYDGERMPVPDAMIEIWQADSDGQFHDPSSRERKGSELATSSFFGYGRSGTDETGAYWFETIKPGRVPIDRQRTQAPHISVAVFGRGLLNHLLTRLYFADEPANADDPVLRCVPADRRVTLIAQRESGVSGKLLYRFDIVLQGKGETAFFNWCGK